MARLRGIPPPPPEWTYVAELSQREVDIIRLALRRYKYSDYGMIAKRLKEFDEIKEIEMQFGRAAG